MFFEHEIHIWKYSFANRSRVTSEKLIEHVWYNLFWFCCKWEYRLNKSNKSYWDIQKECHLCIVDKWLSRLLIRMIALDIYMPQKM